MRNFVLILLILIWSVPSGYSQLKVHSFENVELRIKENPRPVVVFIHTSWCKYCQMMMNSTFKNEEVIEILNRDFYFVSLDAESREDIIFNNHTFSFKPYGQGGIHELAAELGSINGQVIYPAIAVLDSDYSILLQTSSYKDAKTFSSILKSVLLKP